MSVGALLATRGAAASFVDASDASSLAVAPSFIDASVIIRRMVQTLALIFVLKMLAEQAAFARGLQALKRLARGGARIVRDALNVRVQRQRAENAVGTLCVLLCVFMMLTGAGAVETR